MIRSKDDLPYWEAVDKKARELGTDGCSKVKDWHLPCCQEHDIHYRLAQDMDGNPISRREADKRFRACIQDRSPLGKASPMAAWRWAGVRIGGWWGWRKSRQRQENSNET